jgi:endonuclease/exonuclease/phosphatase family metal-dependent hydrolase
MGALIGFVPLAARCACILAWSVALLHGQASGNVAPACRPPTVAWHSLASQADREVLDHWCDSVGPPFVMTGAPPPPQIDTLVFATWNVHAGNGDVEAFLSSLTALPDVRQPYGVVLLLQEAVRASVEVPEAYPARMRPPGRIRAPRTRQDVSSVAERLGLHAAYVPSMRNGRLFASDAREDRGNAILSSLPLEDVRALELPFGRQRHVAVAARVSVAGLPPIRVISLHLDPSGHRAQEAAALAAHLREWTPAGEALVIGGDLNTWFGRREEALKTLAAVVPEEDCGRVKTNTWPWRMQGPFGWWRGRLDYLFSSLPADVVRGCQTVPRQFGSDHRPVVLSIPVPTR